MCLAQMKNQQQDKADPGGIGMLKALQKRGGMQNQKQAFTRAPATAGLSLLGGASQRMTAGSSLLTA